MAEKTDKNNSFIQRFFNARIEDTLKKNRLNFKDIKDKVISTTHAYLSNFYYNYLGKNSDVVSRTDDYTSMFSDPIIASAMEIYVDDATQFSPITRKKIWASIKDKKQQNIADALFADLGLDDDCWTHFAKLCVFGNLPIRVFYKNPDGSGGIVNIEIEENTFRYIPVEINGVMVKWIDKYADKLLEPFEVIFGRINILNIAGVVSNYYDFNVSQSSVIDVNRDKGSVVKNTFKYGSSMFENVRRIWRQLKLLEDNMILTRLDRSPVVRIFKVDTTGMTTQTAMDAIDFYNDILNKDDRILSVNDDLLRGTNGQVGYGTNIIVPTQGVNGLDWKEFGGNSDVQGIVDIDYFTDKFFGGIKIPREYFGIRDSGGGIKIGDGSLEKKDIRYARTVKKLQFGGIKIYKDLLFYHFLSLKENIEYEDINVLMNIVSTAEDQEFKDSLKGSMESVGAFVQLINTIKDFLFAQELDEKTRNYLLDYLSTRLLNNNDFNFKEFFKELSKSGIDPEEAKQDLKTDAMINAGTADKNEKDADKKKSDEAKDKKDQEKKQKEEKEIKECLKRVDYRIYGGLKEIIEDNKIIATVPKFDKDKNLKYCESIFKNKDSRMIFESWDSKKKLEMKTEHVKKLLEKVTAFDVGLFELKTESVNIDFDTFTVKTKYIIEKLNLNNIIFMENLYEKNHILNNSSDNGLVTLFKLEKKLYCNYTNGCKLFRNIFNDIDSAFEVVELEKNVKK